jgi:hypothetical protein
LSILSTLRLRAAAAFVLLNCACVRIPHSFAPASDVSHVGGTAIELRHGRDDEEVAHQVQRVLPAAVRAAQRWGSLGPSVILTIHPSHQHLEAAVRRPGNPWMRAWSRRGAVDLQTPRTWHRASASDAALAQIMTHELTHCVLLDTGVEWDRRGTPFWFREGIATVTAEEFHTRAAGSALSAPAMLLRDDADLVYGTADRAFRILLERYGADRIRSVLSRVRSGGSFEVAFREELADDLPSFERDVRLRLDEAVLSARFEP